MKFTGRPSNLAEPTLIIETPSPLSAEPELNVQPVMQESPQAPVNIKSAQLDKIRKQITERTSSYDAQMQIPLEKEKLQEAWQLYTQFLKEKKNPASQSFERAILNIITEANFEVITNNNLEQRFIEQEKERCVIICKDLSQINIFTSRLK